MLLTLVLRHAGRSADLRALDRQLPQQLAADRLAAAQTAALVLEAAPAEHAVPEALVDQLLDNVGARTIAIKIGGIRRLLAVADPCPRSARGPSTCARQRSSRPIRQISTRCCWNGGDRL
jgi:hypothetical protein